jgi:hypothetical protein
VVVWDFKTTFDFTLNLRTASAWFRAELPAGLTLDLARLEQLFRGRLVLPQVNLLELMGRLGVGVEAGDEYDRWRAALPPGAYAASRRWVGYAAPETLANEAAAAWLTGGLSLAGARSTLREHLLLEADDLLNWAEYHGVREADRLLRSWLSVVLGGEAGPGLPRLRLEVAPVHWEYTFGPLLSGTPGPFGRPATIRVPHLGFSVRVEGDFDDMKDPLDRLSRSEGARAEAVLTRLAKEDGRGDLGLLLAGPRPSPGQTLLGQRLKDALTHDLGLDAAGLRPLLPTGSSVLDLRTTRIGLTMARRLQALAVGNEAGARLERLELDLATLSLTLRARLHHRHAWARKTEDRGQKTPGQNSRTQPTP